MPISYIYEGLLEINLGHSKKPMRSFAYTFALTVNFFLLTVCSYCQPVQQEWVARYNSQYNMDDYPYRMTIDRFSNSYITGTIGTPAQGNDIATVKYNSGGVQQWAVTFNQVSNTNEQAKGVSVDSTGNIYITGTTGYNLGPFDIVTVKYNSSGVQQWSKLYQGTAGNTDDSPGDIGADRSGNIYVCGGTGLLYNPGNALVIKYNTNGDSIWVRRYPVGGLTAGLSSLAVDRFNNVYATGIYTTINRVHALTVKYDSSGALQWAAQYVSNTNQNDYCYKLALDSSGNAYVTGATFIGTPSTYLTIKYSTSGIQQWARNYSGSNGNEARSIVTDKFGNAYVTGSTSTDNIVTIKYDSNGDSLWVRRFITGGIFVSGRIAIAADDTANVYVVATPQATGITTVKYAANGDQQWVISYPGQSVDVAVDNTRNVYVSGYNSVGGTGVDYITLKYSQISGIHPVSNQVPGEFKLYQNYPNPFNSSTKFKVDIASNVKRQTSDVRVVVRDILGREVGILVNGRLRAGYYEVDFEGTNYPSGIYFYTVSTSVYTDTKKMILIK
jgi:beta-propeller repeat-containing protein/type IX secretion system substrate protein